MTAPATRADRPHLLPYAGVSPALAGPPRAAQAGHVLIGRLTLGRSAWLAAGSVIRADGHFVRIGDGFVLGRGATVHIAHERYPTVVDDEVTVGANAVVHACSIAAGGVIEEDCVVLDGTEVGAAAVLAAGSIAYPRSRLQGGWLHAGRPARPVRPLHPGEHVQRAAALRARVEAGPAGWPGPGDPAVAAPDAFVADTAALAGAVHLAAAASLWYGCRLDARAAPIAIGERCNVQDNSVLAATAAGITLGADTTIGHNVALADCTVGARCLIGIGSRIAPGTRIPDDTFVAAGAVTTPGQILAGGRVWGGDPARPIGDLDDAKRHIVLVTALVYAEYARQMRTHGGPP
jgi:carbonic anhydrase/acetyltransferase-like protein (isoleucine patch superfamily)